MRTKRFFLVLATLLGVVTVGGVAPAAAPMVMNAALKGELENVYSHWRKSMVEKDVNGWRANTARSRKMAIRNRIYSERRAYPQAVFQLPAAPPTVKGLQGLGAHKKGVTATSIYFGKVDFGVGGKPVDNLLLLHFVNEGGAWKYDTADFINLMALPKVRAQLKAGDYSYVQHKDFLPSGVAPLMPIAVGPAKYIAKVYVFCPGREVRMKVNKISDHRFIDTKAAEVVIGGGKDGLNEVQFSTKLLKGSSGKEVLSIRVYLMSTVPGVKPIKAFEYQLKDGEKAKPFGSANFVIDAELAKKLKG